MAKNDTLIYDTKQKEYFKPKERNAQEAKERSAKKEALKKILSRDAMIETVDAVNPALKVMHDRVNNAENEEEAKKAQDRLDKYKTHFANKKGK